MPYWAAEQESKNAGPDLDRRKLDPFDRRVAVWALVLGKRRALVFGVAATKVNASLKSFDEIHHPTRLFLAGTGVTHDKLDLYWRKLNPRKVTVGSLVETIRALVFEETARVSPSANGYEESLHKTGSFFETEMFDQEPQDFRCFEFKNVALLLFYLAGGVFPSLFKNALKIRK